MKSPRRLLAITVALALATAASSRAGETYDVSGNDTYQIGNSTQPTVISYSGTQDLAVARSKTDHRFTCNARYTRSDGANTVTMHARFVQEMEQDGSFDDMTDEDPDFLTILNQPFAIELDAHTMHDVKTLRGEVPFEATSPLGGARLTGLLRPAKPGIVRGRPVVGVHFSANGPMTGTLPEHADAKLEGTIHMDGTAYYANDQALLLALDATLTIAGQLANKNATVPVRIVYHRTIRANTASL